MTTSVDFDGALDTCMTPTDLPEDFRDFGTHEDRPGRPRGAFVGLESMGLCGHRLAGVKAQSR